MDYYEEFGVPRSASQREIRSAWKRLARFYHPDLQTDPEMRETAELEMRRLNQMLAVLTQPLERVRYDLMLEAERNAPPAPPLWGPPPAHELALSELLRFDRKAAVWLGGGAVLSAILVVIVMASLRVGAAADHASEMTAAVENPPARLPDITATRTSRVSRSHEKVRPPEPAHAPAPAPVIRAAKKELTPVAPPPPTAKPNVAVASPKPVPPPKQSLAVSSAKSVPVQAAKPNVAVAPPTKPVPVQAAKPNSAVALAKSAPVQAAKPNLAVASPPSKPVPVPTAKPSVAASSTKSVSVPSPKPNLPATQTTPDLAAASAKPNPPASKPAEARLETRSPEPIQAVVEPPAPAVTSTTQAKVARAVEVPPAISATPAPASGTELARASVPASPAPTPRQTEMAQPARPSPGLAGLWRYDPAPESARTPGFYAAEHIELDVFDEAGVLHGYYKAHYLVPAGGVSPDVAFNFSGERGRDAANGTWSGDNGNRGEIRLRALSDNTLEVVWVTTRIKHANSLVSGKVTLRRAN
jgi:hypothetical protein